jgi:MFS family permease
LARFGFSLLFDFCGILGMFLGLLGVLRAYIATASSPRDRVKAIALGMSMFVVGIAVGPALQTVSY